MAELMCPHCGKADSAAKCECNARQAIATPGDAAVANRLDVGVPVMDANAARYGPRWFPWAMATLVGLVMITLVGLITIAVQKLRESASRTHSTKNLRDIGLASHSFHDVNRRLPFNGTKLAVASDNTSGSWAFMLLPFLGEKIMFDREDRSRGLPVLLCPGRGRPPLCLDDEAKGAWSDYCINPFLNSNTGKADAPDFNRTLVGITDGTSNTVFVGHGRLRPEHYGSSNVFKGFTATIFNGGSDATCRGNSIVVLASDASDANPGDWGGPFSHGILITMCDATVRMLPHTLAGGKIGNGVALNSVRSFDFARFLTPNGGEGSWVCGDP